MPKYVCVVSVDTPDYYRGKHWGNETAAPIVKEIFERLIINNDMEPVKSKNMPQYTSVSPKNHIKGLLTTTAISVQNNKVPNFLGKTLKQSIQEARLTGLIIQPVGTSGKVVWQSIRPGQLVHNNETCQIRLESI